jgi:hypothetical protein
MHDADEEQRTNDDAPYCLQRIVTVEADHATATANAP